MATLAYDTFTRADSAVTLGSAESGTGPLTWDAPGWGVLSGKAYDVSPANGTVPTALLALSATGDDVVSCDITFSDTDDRTLAYLYVRYGDGNNWMRVSAQDVSGFSGVALEQSVAGVYTYIGNESIGSLNFAGITTSIVISLTGSTFTCTVDGISRLGSVSIPAPLTTQTFGFMHYVDVPYDNGTSTFDNFLVTGTPVVIGSTRVEKTKYVGRAARLRGIR